MVWLLKTPKAASSTLQELAVALQYRNGFIVNKRQLRVDWKRLDVMTERYGFPRCAPGGKGSAGARPDRLRMHVVCVCVSVCTCWA